MTRNQLRELTDDELGVLLYIVNVIDPMTMPKLEFTPDQLVWFRHDMLIQKLLNAGTRLKPEGVPIFTTLMEKLGVKVEIKHTPKAPVSASTEPTSSNVV